jgi:uncharacterized protein YggT (Ycf19 family)
MSQGQSRSPVLQGARALVLVFYAILMTYVVILLIAFFLRLFGANTTASFVDWIYTAAARIMQPFRGMFPTQQVTSKSVFDASLLFAVIMYWLAALLLHAAVDWLSDRIYQISQRQDVGTYPQATVGPPAASSGWGSPAHSNVGAPRSPTYGDAGVPTSPA